MNAAKYQRYYREFISGHLESVLPQRCMIALAWACERHPQGRLLDAACNDGSFANEARRRGMRVAGFEINEALAQTAKGKTDGIILADMEETWPFRDESFDVIHLGAVIEHLFDCPFVFGECHRVLARSGSLIVSTPNMGHVRHRLEVLFGRVPSWYQNFEHIRMWTIDYLTEKLKPYGLTVTRATGAFEKGGIFCRAMSVLTPSLSSEIVVEATKGNAD